MIIINIVQYFMLYIFHVTFGHISGENAIFYANFGKTIYLMYTGGLFSLHCTTLYLNTI